jgi:hypothetical protein
MWLAISRWQKAAKNPKNAIVYSRRCCALALPRWKSRAKLVAVGDSWRTPTGWVPPPPPELANAGWQLVTHRKQW